MLYSKSDFPNNICKHFLTMHHIDKIQIILMEICTMFLVYAICGTYAKEASTMQYATLM